MSDLVSIITPCYNGEKYIKPFLDSVLQQTYDNIELIFVDDGSTDNTKRIVDSYISRFEEKGFKLIYIYQENAGQAAAVNKGLKLFKGQYLMWIDSDDIMLPDNTKDKVNFLSDNLECGFVLGKGVIVHADDLNPVRGTLQRVRPTGEDTLFEDLIMERNVVFCPGVIMARRDAIVRSIPSLHIYESREGQNWQLMLPLAYYYKCGYLDKVVFKCVEHNDSHSRTKRSYTQTIERYNNFEILLNNTIDGISDMPESEKSKWHRIINEKYVYRKLVLSNVNYQFKESRKYRIMMKEKGYTKCASDNPITYLCKRVVRKLIRVIK